jgi:hypothetical protein
MPSFKLPSDAWYKQASKVGPVTAIKRASFDEFNPNVLGLGNIKSQSEPVAAIAALFDLDGFTNFCKQVEPHLSVPHYLSGFLDWIFAEIRKETIETEHPNGFELWHELPFFTKFMGDGLLILWDTKSMDKSAQHNLIISCLNIIANYKKGFLPGMARKVTDAPSQLRCGIAKGTVYSVGNGNDYVGSCINLAARLQKLASLPLAFSRRGFDPESIWKPETMKKWLLKKVSIRGIGVGELVYVKKIAFDELSAEEKRKFKEP